MFSLRSTTPVFGLTVLMGLASGCDDGETVTFRESKCVEICARYEMCNDQTDVLDCESDCSAESFRSDYYFDVKAECVADLSCNRLAELDESTALDDCIGDDLRDKQLAADALDLCVSLANKLAACVSSVVAGEVQSRCEAVAMTLSEDYLVGTDDCARLSCAEIGSCLSDLADTFNTSVTVYSGKTTE